MRIYEIQLDEATIRDRALIAALASAIATLPAEANEPTPTQQAIGIYRELNQYKNHTSDSFKQEIENRIKRELYKGSYEAGKQAAPKINSIIDQILFGGEKDESN